MDLKKHIELLIYSFLTWLTFYLFGLPDYYQRLSIEIKTLLVIAVTGIYFPVTKYSLTKYWNNGRQMNNACWLAFYLTLPLFIYDYLLLGWYKGLCLKFVVPYWHITLFYFSFWLQFPFIARRMEREGKGVNE